MDNFNSDELSFNSGQTFGEDLHLGDALPLQIDQDMDGGGPQGFSSAPIDAFAPDPSSFPIQAIDDVVIAQTNVPVQPQDAIQPLTGENEPTDQAGDEEEQGHIETYPMDNDDDRTPPDQGFQSKEVAKTTATSKPAGKRTRKKKDPNAPASVSSAYAFFFRDTQASVKTHNPNIKFGEMSKIVASMWQALDDEGKRIYEKKNEEDKLRHEREMKEYRAKLDSGEVPVAENNKKASSKRKPRSKPPEVVAVPEKPTESDDVDITDSSSICIREGCLNISVKNSEWEDEYCSNECVVKHCTHVFSNWVNARRN